jgi:hypothetical protein
MHLDGVQRLVGIGQKMNNQQGRLAGSALLNPMLCALGGRGTTNLEVCRHRTDQLPSMGQGKRALLNQTNCGPPKRPVRWKPARRLCPVMKSHGGPCGRSIPVEDDAGQTRFQTAPLTLLTNLALKSAPPIKGKTRALMSDAQAGCNTLIASLNSKLWAFPLFPIVIGEKPGKRAVTSKSIFPS